MVYKRLLTSLASHAELSSHPSRLIPPYSFTAASVINAPTSLRPPYSYNIPISNATAEEAERLHKKTLRSAQRFSILPDSHEGQAAQSSWLAWASQLLNSGEGRAQATEKWQESIETLDRIRASSSTTIQQIPYHSLSAHLAESAETIRADGIVVVRDVVRDTEAIEWARAILRSINERGGRPVFWNKALLQARSNPSVLSANSQVMRALTDVEQVYVHADSIYEGLGQSIGGTFHLDDVWRIVQTTAHTPLLSHLTLTPSLPNVPTLLSPTTQASVYSFLRPLFKPVRSRISFYSSTQYLHPSNWTLVESTELAGQGRAHVDLPHLHDTEIVLPELAPGDMVFRHSALPVHSAQGSGQVFLPLAPVPKSGNEEWVLAQRERFESGLPPVGAVVGEGMVLIEDRGGRELVGGRAGREAMGYE